MRNISFSMTTEAFREGSKLVTRRLGWKTLKPGMVLMGVEKCQGLKKGEHVKHIHPLRVLSNEREPLMDIVRWPVRRHPEFPNECVLEGFPGLTPKDFVAMFCQHNHCEPETPVQRIEFEHLWDMPVAARVVV